MKADGRRLMIFPITADHTGERPDAEAMRMKPSGKKNLAVLGILAAVAAAIALLLSGLDRIVAAAIEKCGSEAAGTEVRVSSVRIRPAAGEGSIRRLSVANPPGFSAPEALRLEDIVIGVRAAALTGDPVVIDRIVVRAPHVNYEINEAGRSNLDAIRKNLERSRRGVAPKSGNRGDAGRRIVIRKLVIERGRIDVRVAEAPGKPLSAALPRIELENAGGRGGDTPGAVANQVAGRILAHAAVSAPASGIGRLLGDASREAGGALKRLFGK